MRATTFIGSFSRLAMFFCLLIVLIKGHFFCFSKHFFFSFLLGRDSSTNNTTLSLNSTNVNSPLNMSHPGSSHPNSSSFPSSPLPPPATLSSDLPTNSVGPVAKVYPCNVCEKVFKRSDILKKHTRAHTGEKPYLCTVCDMQFSYSNTLQAHKRTHSGEKPFSCEVCGKSFSQNGNLSIHRRIHTGDKRCT